MIINKEMLKKQHKTQSSNRTIKQKNKMRHVTVYTTDKEYNHFVELAKNLHYVKKIETDEDIERDNVLNNIKAGLEEVRLFKKGKLKTTSAKDFLNEL